MAWTQNRNDIITRALRMVNAVSFGNTPRQEHINAGADVLNAIFEDLNNEGIRLWKIERASKTLTASSEVTGSDSKIYTCIRQHTSNADNKPVTGANYLTYWQQAGSTGGVWATDTAYTSVGDFAFEDTDLVLDILYAYIRENTTDSPILDIIDYYEYDRLTDKVATGKPTKLFLEYSDPIKVTMWPIPQKTTYILEYLKLKKFNSIDTANATPDFEKRWWNALTYRLAADLADEFNVSTTKAQWLKAKADQLIEKARGKDFRSTSSKIADGAYVSVGAYSY